ncbi:hypothetical protein L596_001648 [Steinernema carpocapsae]|uniref:Uncharacterized protein n=1 Tax=Steinernema carpocapsae TaxID=34508 RepID=A0A4U8ULU6_STECR|nr:hypothetical protein L596_001648 [Steinernema carpocapsae]
MASSARDAATYSLFSQLSSPTRSYYRDPSMIFRTCLLFSALVISMAAGLTCFEGRPNANSLYESLKLTIKVIFRKLFFCQTRTFIVQSC